LNAEADDETVLVDVAAAEEKCCIKPFSDYGSNGGDGYFDFVTVQVNGVIAVVVKAVTVDDGGHFGLLCVKMKGNGIENLL
jgi:hypothetical protein